MSGIIFSPSVAAQSYTCGTCLKMFNKLIFKTFFFPAIHRRYSLSRLQTLGSSETQFCIEDRVGPSKDSTPPLCSYPAPLGGAL